MLAQSSTDFYKKAKKAFDKYQQSEDTKKLEEARSNILKALKGVEQLDDKKATKIWMQAGEIYNEAAYRDYKMLLVDVHHQANYPNAAEDAFQAFRNAVSKADKKWDKSNAMEEMLKTATFISNEGIAAYNKGIYDQAFASFTKVLEIRDYLNGHEHTSILSKKGAYKKHLFRTALSAQKSGENEAAIIYFEELRDTKYNDPVIYSSLSDLYFKEGKKEKSFRTIKEGRKIYPDNEGLMIAEINYYLKKEELDILIEKLEAAAGQNPENVSILSALGHSYNQLQIQEAEKGNFTDAQMNFQKSMDFFSRALEVEGTYAPALYNIGALYYNKAAIITQELQSLEKDNSAKGIRVFSAKKSEMSTLLNLALPYFQRAEAVNPNDQATLLALKEIYVRKSNDPMIQEMSNRLEQINAGQIIEQSHFGN